LSEITVQIQYFNILADYTGKKKTEVCVPDGTPVHKLLDILMQTNPDPFRRALQQNGKISPYVRVLRNGELVSPTEYAEPLRDQDNLILFLAIAGGSGS
jgi:molybdopterin converting factor small subunit